MAEDKSVTLKIYRGDDESDQMVEYAVPVAPGMVVLDAVRVIHAADLTVRWNCKSENAVGVAVK